MRVFGRVLVLAGLIWAFGPATADALPIIGGGSCGSLVPLPCQLLPVTLGPDPLHLSGDLENENDVALFSFLFDEPSRLTVTTTSYAAGSFDPTLALFHADGSILQYLDPEGSGALIPARLFDIDLGNQTYDDHIDLVLEAGSYLLALLAYPNDFTSTPETLNGGYSCDFGCASLPVTRFDFDITAAPPDGQPQPVPEPGTLVLLGTGMLAAIGRARAKKRV